MSGFTFHFDNPVIRGSRFLIRATLGNHPYFLANWDGAVATSRIVPTPGGGIELITIRVNGQAVAFEMDSFNALECFEFLNRRLPPALRPAPISRAAEMQILYLSRHFG
ncbi:8ed8118d-96e3-47f8-8cbc-1075f08b03a1-CDS [Sclerotinia trifoliorum]|uniref:8ed8118d-96e3-47f8-8cbc-1075f08b03a1-CDS n=1 Tax=Sclerotinia trifoliorum TaxID=28548 RepID=A0A8H2ZSM4_9HELO|nr:8ed8118d-96e3-47f8-8cbc-1075f08b03a1-CDS [Sclerotinia trifoliorum]